MTIGEILRRIRSDGKWTLGDVESQIQIKSDYLSKIERNQRSPNEEIIKNLSKFYGINETELMDLYYVSKLKDTLNHYPNSKNVIEILTEMYKDKNYTLPIPKPSNINHSGSPIFKETKYGKVKGLNYYVQSNGKLKKRERESLIKKSEYYYSEIQNIIGSNTGMSLVQLDEKMEDSELVQQWNNFYEQFGWHFDEFKDKIVKEKSHSIPQNSKRKKVTDDFGLDDTFDIDF